MVRKVIPLKVRQRSNQIRMNYFRPPQLPRHTSTKLIAMALTLFIAGSSNSAYAVEPNSDNLPIPSLEDSTTKVLYKNILKAYKADKAEQAADNLYDLGKYMFSKGKLSEAVDYISRAMKAESKTKRTQALMRCQIALALIYTKAGKLNDAIATYEDAIQLAKSNDMKEQEASLLNSVGTLSIVTKNFEKARQSFTTAMNLAQAENRNSTYAACLVNLALIERLEKNPQKAIEYLKQACTLLANEDKKDTLGKSYLELARTQADLGLRQEAINSYEEAVKTFNDCFDDLSKAKCLLAIGQLRIAGDQLEQARQPLEEAQRIVEVNPESNLEFDLCLAKGNLESLLGNFENAQVLHKRALENAQKSKDKLQIQKAYCETGYDYFIKGNLEKALNYFQDSLAIAKERNPQDYESFGVLYTDIAMCYRSLGQTQTAIGFYERSNQYFQKAADLEGQAYALNNLAVCYLDSGKLEDFESAYNQAKQLFSKTNNNRGQATLFYNYAQYKLFSNAPSEAVKHYQESLESASKIQDSKLSCQILSGQALAYYYLGDYTKSLGLYQTALQLANQIDSFEAKWDCNLGVGKCLKSMGKLEQAKNYLEAAANLVEKERCQYTRDSFKTFNMDLRQDTYHELIDLLVSEGKIEEALEYAEKSRARAFLDLLEGRKQNKVAIVEANIPAPLVQENSPKPTQPGAQQETKTSSERSVDVIPKKYNLVEASTISPVNANPPTLSEIKSLVKQNDSVFVEYYVLPNKVLVWVIYPDGKIVMAEPIKINASKLSEEVRATIKAITASPKSFGEVKTLNQNRQIKLKELHKLLIANLEKYLPQEQLARIMIVPHGPLFSLPFAALLDENQKYFLEKHTIAYTPAIGVLRATSSMHHQDETNTLLAFGNPITKVTSFLGALPYAEKEVNKIAELFPANNSLIEVGANATIEKFQATCSKYSLIHMATHGLIDEEHPMDSALALAPDNKFDGLMTVKDILSLPKLNCKLIVLSACQTAKGKITGDGVVGLSRAFIVAGTPSIIVSQWNVDDVMTEYQMIRFYKQFLAGKDKAYSLRQAQLETIAFMEKGGSTNRANPRYWAAFELIGEH